MQNQKSSRRLSSWALAFALAAVAAPAAQARHAPGNVELGTTPSGPVDAATRHHHPDVFRPPTRIVAVPQASTFDWGDAGIGAGAAVGAVLLIGGSALLLNRSDRPASPARLES
jgi:hypothetical protein